MAFKNSEEMIDALQKYMDEVKVSNCCGASIIENTDLCSDCKEHCEVVEEKDEK